MKSMTGYGEATGGGRWAKVSVQLRTVNHRHLDIQLRVPREYWSFEEEIRKRIREKIPRGRVEVFITRAAVQAPLRTVELDEKLIGRFVSAWRQAKRRLDLKGDLDLAILANRPELFQISELESKDKNERKLALKTLRSALASLERSRRREGRHLQSDMQEQARQLNRVYALLAREWRAVRARPLEPAELRREAATVETQRSDSSNVPLKGDIHEEVVRLNSHLRELAKLVRQQGPAGKTIDFLLQEIHRELNTIGSKLPHLSVVRAVLEGKERVEKIREQTQNIE